MTEAAIAPHETSSTTLTYGVDMRIYTYIGLLAAALVLYVDAHIGALSSIPLNQFLLITLIVIAIPSGILTVQRITQALRLSSRIPKFLSVGSLNTLVDLALLNTLLVFTQTESIFLYTIFKALSFSVTVSHSYLWNKYWVFEHGDSKTPFRDYTTFFVISSTALLINITSATLFVLMLSPVLGYVWSANIGALAAGILTMSVNFFGYRRFAFRK